MELGAWEPESQKVMCARTRMHTRVRAYVRGLSWIWLPHAPILPQPRVSGVSSLIDPPKRSGGAGDREGDQPSIWKDAFPAGARGRDLGP